MGQKDKARALIEQRYNFATKTAADQTKVYEIADRVASGLNLRLGASLARDGRSFIKGDKTLAYYGLKGPGGLVTIAKMALVTEAVGETETRVELSVEEFTYQKGALGTKPTINGAKHLNRFVDALKVELGAA